METDKSSQPLGVGSSEGLGPLVWRYKPMVGAPWSLSDDGYYVSCKRDQGYIVEPLYAAPQPLSGLDVERLLEDVIGSLPVARKLVRAVEAEVIRRMAAPIVRAAAEIEKGV